jgi:plastocyanin
MTFVHLIRRVGLAAGVVLVALAAISPALGADAGVKIVEKQFDPHRIVVAQGDKVTWTVSKAIGEPHTVTSAKNGDTAQGAVFDSQKDDPGLSKLKEEGTTYSFTFDKAGTYPYLCIVHAGMTGEVVVLAPGESAPPETGPGESGTPASEAPGAGGEGGAPIAPERKLIGAGILALTLILGFGAAAVFRRMNPA